MRTARPSRTGAKRGKERFRRSQKVKSDAAVDPGDQHQHCLHRTKLWPRDPEVEQSERVGAVQSIQRHAKTFADQVRAQKHRNAEPEDELNDLRRFPAKVPPLIERPQPKRRVNAERRIEQQGPDRAKPERHVQVEAILHGIERDIAQRMIEVVRQQIREKNDAAGQPHLTHADAAQELERLEARYLAIGRSRHRILA